MLPLTTALLDTLKILMIGNSLSYYNQMPITFSEYMNAQGLAVEMDTIFMPGSSLECLFIQTLYPDIKICSPEVEATHQVWQRDNPQHAGFVKLLSGHDVIYLQAIPLEDDVLYEIISSIDKNTGKDVAIIVFQPYKNITWNEEVRKKELVKEYEYFNSHNKSEKVVLLPIGDLFDLQMKYDDRVKLLDSTNHPTTYGSKLIAEMLGELVMEIMNK
ncbi:MAG: hypothetical protein H7X99_06505 [Saprospiraceae bacterium]|nr:hypothetical protein [Saprospiraceae bacterium]